MLTICLSELYTQKEFFIITKAETHILKTAVEFLSQNEVRHIDCPLLLSLFNILHYLTDMTINYKDKNE